MSSTLQEYLVPNVANLVNSYITPLEDQTRTIPSYVTGKSRSASQFPGFANEVITDIDNLTLLIDNDNLQLVNWFVVLSTEYEDYDIAEGFTEVKKNQHMLMIC